MSDLCELGIEMGCSLVMELMYLPFFMSTTPRFKVRPSSLVGLGQLGVYLVLLTFCPCNEFISSVIEKVELFFSSSVVALLTPSLMAFGHKISPQVF